jgi:hypothetical protein
MWIVPFLNDSSRRRSRGGCLQIPPGMNKPGHLNRHIGFHLRLDYAIGKLTKSEKIMNFCSSCFHLTALPFGLQLPYASDDFRKTPAIASRR